MPTKPIYTTGLFEEDWAQFGFHPSGSTHLMNLILLVAGLESTEMGECLLEFPFVKSTRKAGLYVTSNEFGRGWVSYAYYGQEAPLYLIRLQHRKDLIVAEVKSSASMLTYCEQVFREWVTVR